MVHLVSLRNFFSINAKQNIVMSFHVEKRNWIAYRRSSIFPLYFYEKWYMRHQSMHRPVVLCYNWTHTRSFWNTTSGIKIEFSKHEMTWKFISIVCYEKAYTHQCCVYSLIKDPINQFNVHIKHVCFVHFSIKF